MLLGLLSIVTIINVLVATAFAVAGVFFPGFIVRGGESSRTARVFALYSLARTVPLLVSVIWAVTTMNATGLLWLGALAGVIQLADAAVGTRTGDPLKIWGPLALGLVQLLAVLLAYWWG